MNLKTVQYTSKLPTLPQQGRHLLAWYNDNAVLVYIPHIGEYYDDRTVSRPVWITPSFSWMMHECDWLTSGDYETIECMMVRRFAFEDMLLHAFPADYPNKRYTSEKEWKKERTEAMIQYRWQSDYSPDGQPLAREILLLGIHSRVWMQYVIKDQIVSYNAIDEALFKQKDQASSPFDMLVVPDERPYPIDASVKRQLDMSF